MIVETLELKLYAPWVHSLKEKRMVVSSLVHKTQSRFKLAVAEVDTQDVHQTITIGIACVGNSEQTVSRVLDQVLDFIESSTEAEILEVIREQR